MIVDTEIPLTLITIASKLNACSDAAAWLNEEPHTFRELLMASIEWWNWAVERRLIPLQLQKSDLRGANLTGANLIGANLSGADLRDAKLIGADLRDAKLIGADLFGADLSGADLSDARLDDPSG